LQDSAGLRRAAILVAATIPLCAAGAADAEPQPIGAAQSAYLMRCGGCHGIEGVSVPGLIPTLRGRVGALAGTARGRDYMLHLPNVAMSRLDDATLASVLNFVVFGLGGASTAPGTLPFTAHQVHAALRDSR
jgi:mono/diheme cytochrome c family protein